MCWQRSATDMKIVCCGFGADAHCVRLATLGRDEGRKFFSMFLPERELKV